jgi:hypothetical protein
MTIDCCPVCGETTPRLLDAASEDAVVNYYRCPTCHHVWAIDKDDGKIVNVVTPLPAKSKLLRGW